MKKDDVISMYELITRGWKYSHDFDGNQVWSRGTSRLMWNSKTGVIILVFTENDRYATW